MNINTKSALLVLSTVTALYTNTNASFAETSKPVSDSDGDFDFAQELIDTIKDNKTTIFQQGQLFGYNFPPNQSELNARKKTYLNQANEKKFAGQAFNSATYYCALIPLSDPEDTKAYLKEINSLLPKMSPLELSLVPLLLYSAAYVLNNSRNIYNTHPASSQTTNPSNLASSKIAVLELALKLELQESKSKRDKWILQNTYLLLSEIYKSQGNILSAEPYLRQAIEINKLDLTSNALYANQIRLIDLYRSVNDKTSSEEAVKTLTKFLLNNNASAYARFPYFKDAIDLSLICKLPQEASLLYKKQMEVALFCLHHLSEANQNERQYIRSACEQILNPHRKYYSVYYPNIPTITGQDKRTDLQLVQIALLINLRTEQSLSSPISQRNPPPSYFANCSKDQVKNIRKALEAYKLIQSFTPYKTHWFNNTDSLLSELDKRPEENLSAEYIASKLPRHCSNPLNDEEIKNYISQYESGQPVKIKELFSNLELYANHLIHQERYKEAKTIIEKIIELRQKPENDKDLGDTDSRITELIIATKGQIQLEPGSLTKYISTVEKVGKRLSDTELEELHTLPNIPGKLILAEVIRTRELKYGKSSVELIEPLRLQALDYLHTGDKFNFIVTNKRILNVARESYGVSGDRYYDVAIEISNQFMKANEYDEAIKIIDNVLLATNLQAHQTKHAYALMEIANTYASSKDYAKSIQIAEAAIAREPASDNFLNLTDGSLSPPITNLFLKLEKSNNFQFKETLLKYWLGQVKTTVGETDYYYFLLFHLALSYKEQDEFNKTSQRYSAIANRLYREAKHYFAKTKGSNSTIYIKITKAYSEKSIEE